MLFRTWHRRGRMPDVRWERAAAKARREVPSVARRAPLVSEAQNIAKRFRDHGDAYFTFLHTPGIEPTNNGPARQIRFLAIDRQITQGTRGAAGRRGASVSGQCRLPVPSRTVRPSTSSTARSSPISTSTPFPPSCLYLHDRVRPYCRRQKCALGRSIGASAQSSTSRAGITQLAARVALNFDSLRVRYGCAHVQLVLLVADRK